MTAETEILAVGFSVTVYFLSSIESKLDKILGALENVNEGIQMLNEED